MFLNQILFSILKLVLHLFSISASITHDSLINSSLSFYLTSIIYVQKVIKLNFLELNTLSPNTRLIEFGTIKFIYQKKKNVKCSLFRMVFNLMFKAT